MLQCLADLDEQLRALGSRLFVLRGRPEQALVAAAREWGVTLVTLESDTEPYAIKRDEAVILSLADHGIRASAHASHTLHDPHMYLTAAHKATFGPKVFRGADFVTPDDTNHNN